MFTEKEVNNNSGSGFLLAVVFTLLMAILMQHAYALADDAVIFPDAHSSELENYRYSCTRCFYVRGLEPFLCSRGSCHEWRIQGDIYDSGTDQNRHGAD